jgi:hypothetical protein
MIGPDSNPIVVTAVAVFAWVALVIVASLPL